METLAELLIKLGLEPWVANSEWVWPICEIIHFIGMAMLIGSVGLLDLRILGVGKGLPIAKLEPLVRIGIAGFIMNFVTGFIFVAGNPVGGPIDYLQNLSFQIKMVLILVAGLNTLAFYFTGVSRAAAAVGAEDEAPRAAKIIAATSLLLWFGVIFFGRLIMYNDTLLITLGL